MPTSSSPSVCIIGAGLAGLAAAHALAAAGIAAVVVDKSRGVGGRAATRWRDVAGAAPFRWRVDHGAQVFSPDPGSPADVLARQVLSAADIVEIAAPVVPFSDDGTLRPDETRTDGAPRLAFRGGYTDLARGLAAALPRLNLRLETAVTRLEREGGVWTVVAETPGGSVRLGPFRAALLTPPAPQAAAIVGASTVDPDTRNALAEALAAATYRAQYTVVLAFDSPVHLPGGAYALVNADGAAERHPHAIAWLADEAQKPNRAPQGAGLLIAQMSDAWTRAHYDDDRADIVALARQQAEALVGPLPEPLWTDTQRWRYSLPNSAVDAGARDAAAALGLIVAGDGVAGAGRAHLALESGLDAAERLGAGRAA